MSVAARSIEAPSLPRAGTSPLAVGLALASVYVFWGSTYLGIRVTLDTMPPLLMGATRFLVAGALLFAWSARRGPWQQDRLGRRQWLGAFLVGAALLFLGNGGVILAERTVPSGVVALVIATVPLWMALIDRVGFGQRLRPLAILGLALGFGGVALLLGSPGSGRIDPLGGVIAVLAPVFWALGSVYSRRLSLPTRPLVATAMQMLCAGGLYLVAGVAAGELGRVHLSRVSGASALALAYHLRVPGGVQRLHLAAAGGAAVAGLDLRVRQSDRGGDPRLADSGRARDHPDGRGGRHHHRGRGAHCDCALSTSCTRSPVNARWRVSTLARVSMSRNVLSWRMRTMRGKRRAKPELWRPDSMMASKATSRTTSGWTSRKRP